MDLIKKLFGRHEAKPNIVVGEVGMDYLIKYTCGCWDAPASFGREWMPCHTHRKLTYEQWLDRK